MILPVVGFDGYFVSRCGKVFSTRTNSGKTNGKMHELKPCQRTKKYPHLFVVLHKNKEKHCFFVHVLVLEIFVCKRPVGKVVRHLDGNGQNNNVENLCWGTQKENIADKKQHGTWQGHENHPQAKMNIQKVRLLRFLMLKLDWKFKKVYSVFGKVYGMTYAGLYNSLFYNWGK